MISAPLAPSIFIVPICRLRLTTASLVIFGLVGVIWAVAFFRWYRDNPRDHSSVNEAELAIIEHQNNAFYTDDGRCLVEGFLIENMNPAAAGWNGCQIQPADFDRQLYGAGLMVWHWDFVNYESLGNDNVLRPMLDIEEFDRRDGRQELGTGITRGQPLDLFWGDPVGISG